MAAKDKFHQIVKSALINDGWKITHDPYEIRQKGLISRSLEIDLGAERIIGAEKGTEKIAVEIKSLISESIIYEFHAVLGQYLNYQVALEIIEPNRTLFVAIPEFGHKKLLKEGLTQIVINRFKIKLIIFDSENQNIVKWEM